MPDPNQFTEDADQTGQLFDIAQPTTNRVVAPPPPPVMAAPTPPPAMAMPPGSPGVAPPPINPQWSGAERLQRARDLQGFPINQAEAAVSSALKFQGIRGYQKDLQNGVSPSDAFAKWMPIILAGSKNQSLSGAASMIRATRPPVQKPMNVSGIAYNYDPKTQSLTQTPGQLPRVTKNDPLDTAEGRQILSDISKTETELDAEPSGPTADDLRSKIRYKRQQLQDMRNRRQTGVAPPPAPASPTAPQRITTQAQFDALPSGAIYIGQNGHRYRKP